MAGRLINRLRDTLVEGMTPLDMPEEMKQCDLLVWTPAGYAFFRIIDPQQDIVASWRTAQDEIAVFLRRLSRKESQSSGVYLALLVEGERQADNVKIQRIAANPFVCRKIIIPGIDERNLEEKVWQLPFFPLPKHIQHSIRRLPADPSQVCRGTGLSEGFLEALLGRVGSERIKEELLKQSFDAPVEDFIEKESVVPVIGRTMGEAERLKVRKIMLQSFRNYGPAREPISLEGDLIVIYGSNGTGKSSLCEALEWALTGQSAREETVNTDEAVSTNVSSLLNLRGNPDMAKVEVWLDGPGSIRLQRTIDRNGNMNLKVNGRRTSERDVLKNLSLIMEEETPRMSRHVRSIIRHCHFLSQVTIQGFLTDSPDERYQAYSYMAGTQHLAWLNTKAEAIASSLRSDLEKLDWEISNIKSLIQGQEDEKAKWLSDLLSAGVGQVPDECGLVRQAEDLHGRASALNAPLDIPETPGANSALLTAEVFLGITPGRMDALRNQLAVYRRLQGEISDISRARKERTSMVERMTSLQGMAIDQRQVVERVTNHRVLALQEVQVQEKTLNDAKRKIEHTEQYLAQHDQLQLLGRNIQTAEQELSTLENKQAQWLKVSNNLHLHKEEKEEQQKNLQKQVDDASKRLLLLSDIAKNLPRWKTLLERRDQLEQELVGIRAQHANRSERLSEERKQLAEARTLVEQRETKLVEARRVAERRQQLLAELQGNIMLQEKNCPLCGHEWNDHQALLTATADMLQRLPVNLREAQNSFNETQAQYLAFSETVSRSESELKNLVQAKQECEHRLEELLPELEEANTKVESLLPGQNVAQLNPMNMNEMVKTAEEVRNNVIEALGKAEVELSLVTSEITGAEEHKQVTSFLLARAREQLGVLRLEQEKIVSRLKSLNLDYSSREEALADLRRQHGLEETAKELLAETQRQVELADRQIGDGLRSIEPIDHEVQVLEGALHNLDQRNHVFEAELHQLGINEPDTEKQAQKLTATSHELERQLSGLSELIMVAERLLARAKAFELSKEIQRLDQSIAKLKEQQQALVERRSFFAGYAEKMNVLLAKAKELKAREDKERLDGLEPLTQHLYQRFSCHPFFGPLDLDLDSVEQKLYIRFKTEEGGLDTAAVNRYFSAAQANVVALSIFMGTALLQSWSRLGILCIDDPVQHMDDINTYAFLDLLHTICLSGRQIIVTTASEELYKIMLARFAPLNNQSKLFQALRLIGVAPEGPEILDDTPKPF